MNQRCFPWLAGIVFILASGCQYWHGLDDDTPPTACFGVSPAEGTTVIDFSVDASCSHIGSHYGSLTFRWDWENDGRWDTDPSVSDFARHQYGTTGTKTIKLEVTDVGGLKGTRTHTVTVTSAPPPAEPFVLVPAGSFTMGSSLEERGPCPLEADETQHQVTLTRALYVSTTEVTQAQWQAVMGWNESSFDGPNRPVENVTWSDAVTYCNERSMDEGLTPAYAIMGTTVTWDQSANGYRLLTEAEWEYACRAGSTTTFCDGGISECYYGLDSTLDQVGWYYTNSGHQTHEVGTRNPNAWGIFDMHGNVAEWCWDWYGPYEGPVTDPAGPDSGTYRVARGGGWDNWPMVCRSASRLPVYWQGCGLRVARTAP